MGVPWSPAVALTSATLMVMPKSHSFAVVSDESISTCTKCYKFSLREAVTVHVVALDVAVDEGGPSAVHELQPSDVKPNTHWVVNHRTMGVPAARARCR
jgi:hypothetical protein